MGSAVVISGLGVVSPIGNTTAIFWKSILEGNHSFKPIKAFDTSSYPHHIGSEVHDFVPPDIISNGEQKIYGRASMFAVESCRQALQDAGLPIENRSSCNQRFGVVFGTTFGEAQIIENATKNVLNKLRLPTNITQYGPNSLSVNVAKKFRLRGPNFVVPTACAAGNYAVGYGAFLIASGYADTMLVGGSDPFSHVSFSGFSRLGVMAEALCQPFDKNRRGMIVGEGSGALLLEREDHALSRGVKPYARVLSCGFSCDAQHMTIPDAEGVKSMMKNALRLSQLSIRDIDYICAHGTGTYVNDKTESKAIRDLFYNEGHEVPVSSIKSVLGHTMGAASALETIACSLALRYQTIPPTSNYALQDPECNIDCVPNFMRKTRIRHILNNALAFGGNNASLVLGDVNV